MPVQGSRPFRNRPWPELAWAPALLAAFLAVVLWFGVVDFYHRHFFHHGVIVLADNLARISFLFILSWVIYAPGDAVVAAFFNHETESLTPAERGVLGFGIGIGLWHILLLILGIAGLYYRSVMVCLVAVVLMASARHFSGVAMAACRELAMRATGRHQGFAVPEMISVALIVVCALWLLLVRGLYPGGGGDYYTHYFYYYLDVLNSHNLAPNDVWYHYYYSKGYGLFFLGMLLADPEAPALVTFCCVGFAALALAALVQRTAPHSLWPGCVATLYLLFNLVSFTQGFGGGEFQKDHEQVTALIVLFACALCMTDGAIAGAYRMMATLCVVAVAIIAQPIGVILGFYFLLLSLGAMVRRRWTEMWRWSVCGLVVGGAIAAILALSYWETGLADDQVFELMLRFANIARLDRWGVLPQMVIVAWLRDNYLTVPPPWGPAISTLFRHFMRLDQLWVVLAGSAVATVLPSARMIAWRLRGAAARVARAIADVRIVAAVRHLGSLVAALAGISFIVGRAQAISFERSSTFFFPLLVLFGAMVTAWAIARAPMRWERHLLGWLLPLIVLAGSILSWTARDDWTRRVARASDNAIRFFTGYYSLGEAYSRQDTGLPFGAINPHAFAAWQHVEPGAVIWSTNVDSYCMVPGCWVESVVSFKMSGKLDEIVTGTPARAKELLQEAGLNYFLVAQDSRLLDLLPYSRLFAIDTIGQYLGVRWTDGSAFLLTWLGRDSTPLTPEFLNVYKKLIDQPELPWFQFHRLSSQIADATTGLRKKAWGAPASFAWRNPPPDGTIDVAEATYGQNCLGYDHATAVFAGNATAAVQRTCSGERQCSFHVDTADLGDPAPGCGKNFSVVYSCERGGSLKSAELSLEANGKTANLTCLPTQ